jgi:hypothetical protein
MVEQGFSPLALLRNIWGSRDSTWQMTKREVLGKIPFLVRFESRNAGRHVGGLAWFGLVSKDP